jgi:SNF2 family DNA or RNA helicase
MNGGRGGKGGEVLFIPREDKVVSVRPDGEAHVFDIVCEDPHRNFVANGIVVHNCGKTVMTLAAIPDGAPALAVGPAVAKGVWARECKRWRPELTVSVLYGQGSFRWPNPGELLISNYDVLPDKVVLQNSGECPAGLVLIADEAHYLKGAKAQRTERMRAIGRQALDSGGRVWLLTGTPLLNKPTELWNVLRVADLEREAFESWKKFVELFGGYRDKFNGMHWSDSPDPSVPERLKRVMLRHRKEDVLPDLPAKTHQVIEVDVGAKARNELDKIAFTLGEYCDIRDPYALYEATRRERVVFDTVSKLRHMLATVKTPAMKEFITGYEDASEPLLVFSAHLEPLKALRQRDGWGIIDGSTGSARRTELEEKFQRGELRGLGCSIKAAGTALTLTRAANELFVDESWTPAENEQAEDRANRLGSTRGLLVTRMFADHELDKHVLRVLGRKERLIGRTLGERKEEVANDE